MHITHEDGVAGMAKFPDGKMRAVVAGGYTYTTEVYDAELDEWTLADDLPHEGNAPWLMYAAAAQLADTFVLVGGMVSSGVDSDTILKFNPTTRGWDVLPQRLRQPLSNHVAIPIPDDYLSCIE